MRITEILETKGPNGFVRSERITMRGEGEFHGDTFVLLLRERDLIGKLKAGQLVSIDMQPRARKSQLIVVKQRGDLDGVQEQKQGEPVSTLSSREQSAALERHAENFLRSR